MKWILKKTGSYLWTVALLCLFTAALSFAGVVQALAMRNFLDFAAAGDRIGFLRWFALFFGLIFFQLVGGVVSRLLCQSVSTSLYNKLTADNFHTVLTRDYAALSGRHSGELMQRITSDTGVVTDGVIGIPMQIISLMTQLIAASWCLAFLQGQLAMTLLGCFLLMLIVGLPLKKFVRKYHDLVMEAQGRVRSVLQESLDNQMILRAFQAVQGAQQQAKARMDEYRKIIMRRAVFSQIMGSGGTVAINIAYIIGMLWCGMGIVEGSVTFGTFSAVWQLIGQITGPAMQITGILPQYYTMTASAQRLQELEGLGEENWNPDTDWQQTRDTFSEIRCENLSFSYDGTHQNTILHDLDFTIRKGDFIAITGQSGIGKSTLLKLLLGVYGPEKSSIQVVCTDGRIVTLDAGARNMISYVPQGNFLMSGTIREAVYFWQGERINEEKMKEACRIAQAQDFIESMEQGYDTQLGERGAGLSEGQLQRLAIARAIYSGKPVLLLDEATSALDEQTEAKVLENLKKLQNRTVIIVTHRKAALDICNRIVEMEKGRIREFDGELQPLRPIQS